MNCIIVHGCPSNIEKAKEEKTRTYDKHWMPWIKKQLEEKEIEVFIPLMLTPWNPKYEEWKDIFDRLLVNEDSILIGHSCGGAFLVRWLGETKREIKRLILVSPGKAGRESTKTLSNLYGDKTYEHIRNYVKDEIIIFTAEDDLKYHINNAYEYEKELPAKVIHLGKGYGHFTLGDMGTKKFPELLNKILE